MEKITPLSDIISIMYAKSVEDVALVTHAYEFAKEAHKEQKRYSGEIGRASCRERVYSSV